MKGQMYVFGLLLAVLSFMGVDAHAQTAIFPVSADLAQVKADILLWGAALISVVLGIYAYSKVKGIIR